MSADTVDIKALLGEGQVVETIEPEVIAPVVVQPEPLYRDHLAGVTATFTWTGTKWECNLVVPEGSFITHTDEKAIARLLHLQYQAYVKQQVSITYKRNLEAAKAAESKGV